MEIFAPPQTRSCPPSAIPLPSIGEVDESRIDIGSRMTNDRDLHAQNFARELSRELSQNWTGEDRVCITTIRSRLIAFGYAYGYGVATIAANGDILDTGISN
jgi:hypothetical protein